MSTPTSGNWLEARRLQNLGFFKDAAKYYGLAEAEHSVPQLWLVLEISGVNLEQGLVGVVLDRLVATTDHIDRDREEPLALALFDLLWAKVEALSTVLFTQALRKAVKVFEEHLRGRDPADYDSKRVCWSHTECIGIAKANVHNRHFWQWFTIISAS